MAIETLQVEVWVLDFEAEVDSAALMTLQVEVWVLDFEAEVDSAALRRTMKQVCFLIAGEGVKIWEKEQLMAV